MSHRGGLAASSTLLLLACGTTVTVVGGDGEGGGTPAPNPTPCGSQCDCPTQNDGACDEPEGGGSCPEGTDPADCEPAFCISCSDYLVEGLGWPDDVCGFQGTDSVTGLFLCGPSSSCSLLAEVQLCMCLGNSGDGTGCGDECGGNGCLQELPSSTCEECVFTVCVSEVTACAADP